MINDLNKNKLASNASNLTDSDLSEMWNSFDFTKSEEKIFKLQRLLTLAVLKKNKYDIIRLSKKITSSIEAKVLAVHKVSEVLHSSPGIDNITWLNNSDKMKVALSLSPHNYKSKPLKVFIVKDNHSNKERKIGIPTVYDRAMQILYSMALEPISEATADRKSFAFRKGRSTLDVHSYIMNLLKEKNSPEWFLICDVKSCYDSISHKWLLNNIPIDKYVLRQFIKSGYVFNNELFPSDVGISLGCNISPLLGNMTLDGIQRLLYNLQKDSKNIDYLDGYAIRFADDICISARSKEKAELYLQEIKKFLAVRGLKLNTEKTYLTNIKKGFEFLSRFYYKENGYVHSIPSDKDVKNFERDLEELILDPVAKWSQDGLIEALNSKLRGWATYHRVEESAEVFKHIDLLVNALLLKLTRRLYPNTHIKTLVNKFWFKDVLDRYTFTLTTDRQKRVMNLEDVILVKHKKMDVKKNIFLDKEYFSNRQGSQDVNKVNGKYRAIWNRQNGKCYYCDKEIKPEQGRQIVFKELSNDTSIRNMAYVHNFCVKSEISYINLDDSNIDKVDISKIIYDIEHYKDLKKTKKKSIYQNLVDYFYECNKPIFTLTFKEIENIINHKLCSSAYKYTSYWYRKGNSVLSNSWLDNNYFILRLHLDNQKVVFKRNKNNVSKLDIPEVLFSNTLPRDAVYELKQFFIYIIKKYGL